MIATKQRIGIMGGTFDPIHIGHLVTAEAVRNEYGLDKVLFIPAATPPHKQNQKVTPAIHRYIMTAMATYSNPHFHVSSIELDRPGPSYTIDTIYELIDKFGPQVEIYFITGADAIQEIPTWDRIEELLGLCQFIAATRQGCVPSVDNIKEHFGELGRRRIHRLNTPELEISSTDIRSRIKKGFSIKYIVPESVENYILKEGLYR
ncbi:nicotinate-nucleotide adenylyltransferase [Anaerosinus massiliensis]|uniref:nicotinate-nucleotide adenylyltransferase n=1 Tax=Massilibacillus massiliensis TaxID=1806837 RepID=UPI000B0DD911|nr:nicotinate-nucleotide adenylyltransferase [Massilibacillus massiliensis]